MHRRNFLKASAASGTALAFGSTFWRAAYADPAVEGESPYGPLQPADANGVMLPAGFTSRIVATAGETVPGPTGYVWHIDPDGGAVFPQPDGSYVYTSNMEETPGGVGAIRFATDGTIVDGYRILDDTRNNCAGGPTPWGTWLSCEETGGGLVYECDVTGPGQGIVRPELGAYAHEAVAVDPVNGQLYLTEDNGSGRLYRFTPDEYSDTGLTSGGASILDSGVLEVALVTGTDVTWVVTAKDAAERVNGTAFDGGEGIWYDAGFVYFTTKGDNRVWALDCNLQTIEIIYDDDNHTSTIPPDFDAPLTGVDNVTVDPAGDLYVAEDGGNLELVFLGPVDGTRTVAPFLRMVGHDASEIAGPAFHPAGDRLYFSSQRGPDTGPQGMTFEITGPFRGAAPDPSVSEIGAPWMLPVAAGAAAAGAWAIDRRRRADDAAPTPA